MQCVFYDSTLNKTIPCTLIPNEIHKNQTIKGKEYYVRVEYDDTRSATYGVTFDEFRRYSSEMIPLIDIYPSTNQTQIDYHNACIPNNISGSHYSDELDRFEALVNMLTDVTTISPEVFYDLAEFISYELLFRYCVHAERVFMQTLCLVPLTEQPAQVLIPQMIRMTRRIFDKFPNYAVTSYKIYNYLNFGGLSYITFPLVINTPVLDANVNFVVIP